MRVASELGSLCSEASLYNRSADSLSVNGRLLRTVTAAGTSWYIHKNVHLFIRDCAMLPSRC